MSKEQMFSDLKKSGLTSVDMKSFILNDSIRNVCGVMNGIEGYVIPYFDMLGERIPFYRLRLFKVKPKYKQPKDTQSFVYYPQGFISLANTSEYIVLVEGEKKAAALCKMGIASCALGGVDAWKSRTLILPGDTSFKKMTVNKMQRIGAKLPASFSIGEVQDDSLATGMADLISYCVTNKKTIIICYDNDLPTGTRPEVQKAAAKLGFELRARGLEKHQIRQLVLPYMQTLFAVEGKISIDNFVITFGYDRIHELLDLIMEKPNAFPKHPNMREFVLKSLQKNKINRKLLHSISLAILSDLDSNGRRLRFEGTQQLYYFDEKTKRLLVVNMAEPQKDIFFNSDFGILLYRKYGLTANDSRILKTMSAQFAAETPLEDVTPYRIFARPKEAANELIYQISDAQYVKVTGYKGNELKIFNNGDEGILFESGHVENANAKRLMIEFRKQMRQGNNIHPWWDDVTKTVRLLGTEKQRKLLVLLYYLSPWLYRWKGTQLPVELIVGESGSGKSSLYVLRLNILNGKPILRGAPGDMKDWRASITNSGGLHVTDNVQMKSSSMHDTLSDELCRLITEPHPVIEMRKYFTNVDQIRIPISAVFCFTAIEDVFKNPDLLQRSFPIHIGITGVDSIHYDSNWPSTQLNKFGGREAWMAHQMYVIHKFFTLARRKYDYKYKSKTRLINFEQAMMLMAEVLGYQSKWIPAEMSGTTDKIISQSDWTFNGLQAFAFYMRSRKDIEIHKVRFSAKVISNWASTQDDYEDSSRLTNPRALGKYLKSNAHKIAVNTGIVPDGTRNNLAMYRIEKIKDEKKIIDDQ